MKHTLNLRLNPAVAANYRGALEKEIVRNLGISPSRLKEYAIRRRSIDARQRQVYVNLTIDAYVDEERQEQPLTKVPRYQPLPDDAPQSIVVGAGPAGLYAALRLIEEGVRPIVLERGKDVDSRRKNLAAIARKGIVDPDSNYAFGEGGAGAYSDGKLYTRSKKRGDVDKILEILHAHGADADVLVDAHPHIGTNRLPDIIRSIRNTIVGVGGKVHFETRVNGLVMDGNTVKGVTTAGGQTFSGPVILATGHSARDTYRMLHDSGVAMQPKGIAVGVRLEHPQDLIDSIQYHNPQGRGDFLPPATYSMLTRVGDRAVYSFCMCPGGVVVPASSAPGELVVNGMSSASRAGRWANSGMVVEVLDNDIDARDYGVPEELKMMAFQEEIEKRFYADGGAGLNAPAQRMTDFVKGRPSRDLPRTTYAPGVHPGRIDRLLPGDIATRLARGLEDLGRKSKGFLTPRAVLIGCETRTSAPVRIPRHPLTMQHVEVPGLYPVGEGAGYAGGIVSAAIDGDKAAFAVAQALKNAPE